MKEEKCKNLVNLFQNIFKRPPVSIDEDEFGCTASTVIKHKNAKIILELSELLEGEEVEKPEQPVEFHELKLKNGTSNYIISFYLQDKTGKEYTVRIYIE